MSRPARVLVAGHDSGALNVLRPLLRAWINRDDLDPWFVSTPSVLRDMQEQVAGLRSPAWSGEITESVAASRGDLDSVFSRHLDEDRWDAIVCGTSRLCLLEKRLLTAARTRGIRSFAFCDMWWAYRERFRDGDELCLPDTLWVVDPRMQNEAALAIPELAGIEVVGSPFFEEIAELRLRQAQPAAGGQVIRFFSEPASGKFPAAGIDEFELAELLLDVARHAGITRKIVVRTHPLDAVEHWRRWAWRHRHHDVELDVEPLDECMASTGLALGISSIILAEMAMSGIPTASIQLQGADPDYYCLPFHEFGIARIASREALLSWLVSDAERSQPPLAEHHERAVERITASVLDRSSHRR